MSTLDTYTFGSLSHAVAIHAPWLVEIMRLRPASKGQTV